MCRALSAWAHSSGVPMKSGLPGWWVESSTRYSLKPKVLSTASAKSRQPSISELIWSRVQKMWASSCVKPRTRKQSVHGSGALVAVHVAEFGVALRQIAIRFRRVLVDEDVARAVHGLEAILRVIELHGRVHVFGVDLFMAGDLPELAAHDVRREDHVIAAANALFAHPVFHDLADEAALGVPEDEAGAGDFLDAEQIELLAEHAVVARLDLFKVLEVGVEVFLREERGAVDALQLLILLVAQPVGAGDGGDLECLDAGGARGRGGRGRSR